jgi:hypothetical protein
MKLGDNLCPDHQPDDRVRPGHLAGLQNPAAAIPVN